jgi:pimeloyl-ACP methyl ester carboxylesterase
MKKFNPVIEDNPDIDLEFPASMQPIVFESNGEKLLGTFFRTAGSGEKPTVILLHGFPGNESNFDIAHAIKRFGFNVIVFHYRGSWGSGGSFSISNSLEDLNSAIEYFSSDKIASQLNIDVKKIILIGHSMGGFISLLASTRYPQIKAIGFLAGFNFGLFSNFLLENREFIDKAMDSLSQGSMFLKNTSGKAIYEEMLANKESWNLLNKIIELKEKNILLIGAQFDYVAPLELHHKPLIEGFEKVGINYKSYIYETGHSFSSTRIKLTTDIINWLEQIVF